jgi:uncharacterized RDD family membrane protein YckC
MDDSNQPQEPTQVVPPVPADVPAPPAYPPAAYPPAAPPPAYPPPAPADAAQQPAYPPAAPPPAYPPAVPAPPAYPLAAPPPAYPPGVPPPPGYQQPWAVPMEAIGPAPGVRFASHGARLVAYIVDGILISVLATAVFIALSIVAGLFAAAGAAPLAVVALILAVVATFLVGLGYFPWFWANGGATPGMRIFNLRIVRDRDGSPIGWSEAILRLIGFWVSSLVFYLGFIWIFIDKRRRGWHDLIAGTVMVQPA